MKSLIIQDMKRLGGGRRSAFIFADVLRGLGYETYFVTNVDDINGDKNRVAIRVNYEFVENASMFSNLRKILKLKKQLSKIDIRGFDFSLNHHPNVFIKKGTVNILHGFSFLDPWIDESGNFLNHIAPRAIKAVGLYKEYESSLFIPNSLYTKNIARMLLPEIGIEGEIGDVLHPPILYENFHPQEKKRQVIVVGRINWSKGMEDVLNIASRVGVKFIIAGFVNPGDEEYVKKLQSKAGKNVEIRKNISEDEKKELMIESSTILSVNRKENFGISTAEAMNYGCVPIVPKSGGQWIDIVDEGRYGFGFNDEDEIDELILRSFELGVNDRERIAKSIARFSMDVFISKLRDIVNRSTSNRTL
ncbi:MAG: glycosyltransferase family 4 protein [Candidatus Parvarchaeota archaeon]